MQRRTLLTFIMVNWFGIDQTIGPKQLEKASLFRLPSGAFGLLRENKWTNDRILNNRCLILSAYNSADRELFKKRSVAFKLP